MGIGRLLLNPIGSRFDHGLAAAIDQCSLQDNGFSVQLSKSLAVQSEFPRRDKIITGEPRAAVSLPRAGYKQMGIGNRFQDSCERFLCSPLEHAGTNHPL